MWGTGPRTVLLGVPMWGTIPDTTSPMWGTGLHTAFLGAPMWGTVPHTAVLETPAVWGTGPHTAFLETPFCYIMGAGDGLARRWLAVV